VDFSLRIALGDISCSDFEQAAGGLRAVSSLRKIDLRTAPVYGAGEAALLAMRVLARWRRLGFDLVTCFPSRYCSPANSSTTYGEMPDGYCRHRIDSDEALSAVARSIEGGDFYRL
jgi:hypothetical protein